MDTFRPAVARRDGARNAPSEAAKNGERRHNRLTDTMNTNRRTFRGQSRRTDGNIPHSLSRRNRAARSEALQRSNALAADRHLARQTPRETDDDADDSSRVEEVVPNEIESPSVSNSVDEGGGLSDEFRDEIKHIKRRLRNVHESIQTSKSIVNPTTWEQNCLNAVGNCINEWKSIVARYFRESDEELDDQSEQSLVARETSLAVFGLLQLAMQSGPLTGSNSGYFKRCGGEVARVASKLLESDVLANGDLSETLLFTEKQLEAVAKWRRNAAKAVENNKPPSKSMLKLQQGKGKATAKKEKKAANTKRSR